MSKKYWLLALFCGVLITAAMVPNIFARYTTYTVSGDTARVAYCSVEETRSTVTYYDGQGEEVSAEALKDLTVGVHADNAVQTIVYQMEVSVRTEVAMDYTVQITGLPVELADYYTIRLDNGTVNPTVSQDQVAYYFACGAISPSAEAQTVSHTVTFELHLDGDSKLENQPDGSGYPFAPIVQILFAQKGGNS